MDCVTVEVTLHLKIAGTLFRLRARLNLLRQALN